MISRMREHVSVWGNSIATLPTGFTAGHKPNVHHNVIADYSSIGIPTGVIAGGYRFGSNFDSNGNHDFTVEDLDVTAGTDTVKEKKKVKIQLMLKLNMIALWFYDCLDSAAKGRINVHRGKFEYTMSNGSIVRDGAMMILLALKLINPNT